MEGICGWYTFAQSHHNVLSVYRCPTVPPFIVGIAFFIIMQDTCTREITMAMRVFTSNGKTYRCLIRSMEWMLKSHVGDLNAFLSVVPGLSSCSGTISVFHTQQA